MAQNWVTANVTKGSIQLDDYRECLFSWKEQHLKMNVIRSHCHGIYTEEINKIALSSDDDKRVIMADGIHTLAFGHANLQTRYYGRRNTHSILRTCKLKKM